MNKTEKLDQIIKLLEEIKASQPIPTIYYPFVYYPPQPEPYTPIPDPWERPYWTTTYGNGDAVIQQGGQP